MHDKLAPKVGVVRVTWPKFEIWDPLHNFRVDKAMHSKFCGLIHSVKPFVAIWKFDPKGAWLRSRDHFRNFGTPFISLEGPKIETSCLVHTLIITCTSQCITNWPLNWAWSGSRDLNLKFGTPSITFERIKLRPPNFVGKYTAWRLLSKYENLTLKGRGFGHVTIFEILGPPLYLWNDQGYRNFIWQIGP